MKIKEISQEIHQNNIQKGFWNGGKEQKNVGEVLMLVVSELSEALEADRKDRRSVCGSFTKAVGNASLYSDEWKQAFEEHVKDTFEDEIADAVIRLFDLCEGFGIDLEWHILKKHHYNCAHRAHKHGKKY